MKTAVASLAIVSLALITATSVRAQAVLSADTPFVSEDQVLTLGTEVFGGNENGVSATLANGVDFQSHLNNATFVGTTLSGVTVDTDGSYYGGHANVTAFSDNTLNSMLNGDSVGAYSQVFVDGLTAGNTYVIQVFASMTQGDDIAGGFNNPNSVYYGTEDWVDETQGGSTTLSYGQPYDAVTQTYSGTGVYFFTDTFVATGSQEYLLSPQGDSTNGQALIAAVEVRELPEPSVYGMIGMGLLALVAIGRFRKQAA
jgi:hypothetical protein